MKIFISSDIEGTCGIAGWQETSAGGAGYEYIAKQMTKEVSAVVKVALSAGAESVFVRDAHDTGCNILQKELPNKTEIMRGWTGDIYNMMSGIDMAKYGAVMMTGYHSPARSVASPISHTMQPYVESMKINGELCSEFMLNAYTAGYFGIPVCFVSGDEGICEMAKELIPEIKTAPVLKGVGGATISMQPEDALDLIKEQAEAALADEHYKKCIVELPRSFEIQINYKDHPMAYKNSFYPGAIQVSGTKLRYKSTNYIDVLRFVHFCAN